RRAGDDVERDPEAVGELLALVGDDLGLRLLDGERLRAGRGERGLRLVAGALLIVVRVADAHRLEPPRRPLAQDLLVRERRRVRPRAAPDAREERNARDRAPKLTADS